jgi:hypothetical protein
MINRFVLRFLICGLCFSSCLLAVENESIKPPYNLKDSLLRAEEMFRDNNFKEALIFYFEAMPLTTNEEVKSKLHFRIGECLEAIRRYDYATYHYQLAMKGNLPDILISRSIMKLEHLPEMARKEEAERLFKKAMASYKKRNIRDAIDDYLTSLRLLPSLMAKDESGLIEDAIKYLTYLSESRDKEPARLLKLATLLELKGEVEKSVETLKQIEIIYPDSDEAQQAEEKLGNYDRARTAYLEPAKTGNALKPFQSNEGSVIFEKSFNFNGPGTVSRQLDTGAFTFKAFNEHNGIPANRFEFFSVIVGNGTEQQEFLFSAEDGIERNSHLFETETLKYNISFSSVNQTRGYIQDLYGDGRKSVGLFSAIGVKLTIEKKVD